MDFRDSPAEAEFRDEVRTWLSEHLVGEFAELGGREVGDTDHMVTETLIRGMYRYWREVMQA